MSRQLGLAVLDKEYCETRVPVMEHFGGMSRDAIRHYSGIDVLAQPDRLNEAFRACAEALEVDLLWGGGLPAGSAELFDWSDGEARKTNKQGQSVIQWGVFSTAIQEDGRHFLHIPKPRSVEDALEFDPLAWFPESVEQYEQRFCESYLQMQASCGDTCYPIPHHYTTLFHWPLAIFGFEMLCEAGLHEARFAELMETFAEISVRITSGWARVPDLKAFILHDDLTTTRGPIFRPSWYRKHIFPHYPRIFAPLLNAGVPILFTSDGNCTEFVRDIFDAGADGLNFEYLVDLAWLAKEFPDKVMIGNICSDTIARGPSSRIVEETRACLDAGSKARRFVVNVGGQITHDMSVANLEVYRHERMRLCREVRRQVPG